MTPHRPLAIALLLIAISATAQNPQQAAPPVGDFTISGVVISRLNGAPLPRTRVILFTAGGNKLLSSTTTAEEGHFAFHNLAPGKYDLAARRRGYPQQAFDEHQGFSTAIAVGEGKQSTDLVFRLTAASSLQGTVTDEAGEPVRNGQVMLFRKAIEGNGQFAINHRASTGLDDRGSYRFGNLPAGTYFLAVTARPWYAQNGLRMVTTEGRTILGSALNPDLDVAYPLTYYSGATNPDGARPIILQPGEHAAIEMSLVPVPAIRIQILNINSGNGVPQPSLAQKTLGGGEAFVAGQVMQRTDDITVVSGLAAGNYQLTLQMFSSKGERPKILGRQSIDLSSDAEIDSTKTLPLATVTGVVRFEGSANSLKTSQILLHSRDLNSAVRAPISATGEFETQELPPGWYDIFVPNSEGFFARGISAVGARVAGLRVNISGATPVQLTVIMSKGVGSIDGVVKFPDNTNDKTVAGAMVVLVPNDPANHLQLFRRDQSDSDGTFSLRQIVPGTYTVVAIKNGWDLEWSKPAVLAPYLPGGEVVQVEANRNINVTVKLQ